MECNEHYRRLLLGPIICIIGLMVNIVGLSSHYWSVLPRAHAGLWNICTTDGKDDVSCFVINHRGSVPTVVFVCSFIHTLGTIISSIACLTAILTTCQKKSRILKWSKHSACASLLTVVTLVCCECVYGASFKNVTYENIPNLDTSTRAENLGWSFFVTCASSGISLIGSIYLIIVPSMLLSTNKVTDGSPQIPVSHIHPPPSNRTPTPLYLFSHRLSSPSSFSRPQTQSLPPVFTQLRK